MQPLSHPYVVVWLLLNVLTVIPGLPTADVRPISWWLVIGAVAFIIAFLERHSDFHRRTMSVPFSMALRKLTKADSA